MMPAVLPGEKEGVHSPDLILKWTGNTNMATVGKWRGSRVQAIGATSCRLRGCSLGTTELYKHPVFFIAPVM